MFSKIPSHKNLHKFVIKYIYNNKVTTTFTEMRAHKWKKMKNKKSKNFAKLGPDVDSNFYRTERVIHVLSQYVPRFSESSIANTSYKPWLSNSEWTMYANNAFNIFFTWWAGERSQSHPSGE